MKETVLQKLQSELAPQADAKIDYEGEHSRHQVKGNRTGRILIHNAPFIFTCDQNDKTQILTGHSLVIEGDTIKAVAPAGQIQEQNFDAIYDAGKRGGIVITPGFINTHTHPPMYLMRSAMMLDEGEGVDETIAAMPRWEQAMSETDMALGAIGDITEQQKHGITTTLSHYHAFAPLEQASRLTEQNLINAVSVMSNVSPANSPALIEKIISEHTASHSRLAIALHYLYKATPEILTAVNALVNKYDLLFTCHFAESEQVAKNCEEKFGMRETAVLKKFNLLNDRTLISHVIYVRDEEVKTLAATGVGIAHLPTSNVIHKSGVFPFWKFYDANGLPYLSLGTDSVISKSRLDLLSEAYQTRITHLYDRTVKFSSLFKMMTVNGARILHLPDRGRIAPGCKADLVFWKLRDRGFIPYDADEPMTLLGNIIPHGGRMVRDLMINGRFVIKNRRHQLVDESKLLQQLQEHHLAMRQRVRPHTLP